MIEGDTYPLLASIHVCMHVHTHYTPLLLPDLLGTLNKAYGYGMQRDTKTDKMNTLDHERKCVSKGL